jgi:O-antigen ligase
MIFQVIAVCLVFDYEIRHDSKMFLSVTEFFFSVIIYINFLTILLYPQGMYIGSNGYYSNWFLGFKNIFILYMLPAMLFSYLNSYSKNKISVNTILLSLIIIISIILTNSATGIVGVLVFFATLILSKVIKSTKILNIKVFSYIYIASFLAIVILRLQNLFSFFIVDVLHKDITFTGRTYIWDYVYQFISQKKLLGYGVENSLTRLNKTSYLKSYHAHNQILEIIYKSGFIGLISFILLAYVSLKQLFKHKQTKQALIISITIFSYFVISLTEAYDYEYIMFIFVIAYNIENFIKDVQ